MIFSKEFIQLNIDYARACQKVTGDDLSLIISRLTCIPRSVLGIDFKKGISGPVWNGFVSSLPADPVSAAYDLQSGGLSGHSENRIRSGRISVTLPDQDGLSLVHFSTDITERQPFDAGGLARRKAEFKEVFERLVEFSPAVIGMFSWLMDTRFSEFFPIGTRCTDNPHAFYASLAVWGQYLQADGSLNAKRSAGLLDTVTRAKSAADLVSAHPKKAVEARVPAADMFSLYLK